MLRLASSPRSVDNDQQANFRIDLDYDIHGLTSRLFVNDPLRMLKKEMLKKIEAMTVVIVPPKTVNLLKTSRKLGYIR